MATVEQAIPMALVAFRKSIAAGEDHRDGLVKRQRKISTYLLFWRFFQNRKALKRWDQALTRFDEAVEGLLDGRAEPAARTIRESWPQMHDVTAGELASCATVGVCAGNAPIPPRFAHLIADLERPLVYGGRVHSSA